MPIDYTTDVGQVRLLINDDVEASPVFSNEAIAGFLALEGGNVKRAAAQALDVIADDEALTSKVLKSQDLATNGAAVADGLRRRAAELRKQAGGAADGGLAPTGSFPAQITYPDQTYTAPEYTTY